MDIDAIKRHCSILSLLPVGTSVTRRDRNNWMAKCPFHADDKASLSITQRDHWVFYCHGCQARGTAIDFAMRVGGLTAAEAIDKLGRGELVAAVTQDTLIVEKQPREAKRVMREKREILQTYDYEDENGALLYQVVRFVPKGFAQRRRGNPGWIWNLDGVRKVPYRLRSLLTADTSHTAFVVEGEKDADTMRYHGLLATCNAGGAGKWLPEFGLYLQGRNVVVLPDNDDAGRAHARDVVNSTMGCKSIRVVELPGLPPKGDVSDWFATGHAAKELLDTVARS